MCKGLRSVAKLTRFALSSRHNFAVTVATLAMVSLGFRPVGGAVRR